MGWPRGSPFSLREPSPSPPSPHLGLGAWVGGKVLVELPGEPLEVEPRVVVLLGQLDRLLLAVAEARAGLARVPPRGALDHGPVDRVVPGAREGRKQHA